MSNPRNSGNDAIGLFFVGMIVVGIIVYAAVRSFSDVIGVPTAVGGHVLARSVVAIVLTMASGWLLSQFEHPRRWLITLLVFLACLSVVLWPALDVWAANVPPGLALLGYADNYAQELAPWGGLIARAFYFGLPAGTAAVLFFKSDY